MPKKLIIAAVSARAFVQAAVRAGHEVVALDAFADEDTRRAARKTYRLTYGRGSFYAAEFKQTLQELGGFEADGLVYGSGFEATPALLEEAGQWVPLIGNSPAVLSRLKTPHRFFGMLDALGIAHPQVSYDRPRSLTGWLEKAAGGSGGTHVRRPTQTDAGMAMDAPDSKSGIAVSAIGGSNPSLAVTADMNLPDYASNTYYQREISGEVVSVLFAAAGGKVRIIGFNSQWTAPTADLPYRYGGAVSHAPLPSEVRRQLTDAAQQIAAETGLCGLNSLDAIVSAETVQILEVNPRLSATFELYCDADGRLFDLHLQACGGDLSLVPQAVQYARAQQIVYAPQPLQVPQALKWPAWAADLPASGSLVAEGDPLCSVTAEAGDARLAKMKALEHERILLDTILN